MISNVDESSTAAAFISKFLRLLFLNIGEVGGSILMQFQDQIESAHAVGNALGRRFQCVRSQIHKMTMMIQARESATQLKSDAIALPMHKRRRRSAADNGGGSVVAQQHPPFFSIE